MSDDGKLVATHNIGNGDPRIAWYFASEGEYGGVLGGGPKDAYKRPPPAKYKEDNDTWIAEYAVITSFPDVDIDCCGFVFATTKQATAALRVAKRAIADAKANRAPEPWEALALAAGWTPPKRK
jgi:hypothetical protein